MDQQLVSLLYPTSYVACYNHHRTQQNSDANAALEPPTICYLDERPDPVLDRKGILSLSCNQWEILVHNILNHPDNVFVFSPCILLKLVAMKTSPVRYTTKPY